MEELIAAAFTIGILGSFHCVGMCGPLALAIPLKDDNAGTRFISVLLYNTGRVVTYACFGLIFGLLGKSVAVFGYQQALSIIMGGLIIVFIVLPRRVLRFSQHNLVIRKLEQLRAALGELFKRRNYNSLFFIGLLNGLLPCGLVYMAAAGATATGDPLRAGVFMTFFGLGTVPMMWCVSFFGNFFGSGIRGQIRKLYPYVMFLMATLLIVRGLGLGIPYISPAAVSHKTVVCCHKP